MSMTQIQGRLKAPKGQHNRAQNFKFRSCEDIVEAVKPILSELGCHLNLSDDIVMIGERTYVKSTASIWKESEILGVATAFARETLQPKGMGESQATGAASSYARKYALNGLLAIDDTKDADASEHKQPEGKDLDCLPPPNESLKKSFESVTSLDDLKSLWARLTKEEREICVNLKEIAKKGLQ